ncbi:hypothetical protein [Streptomyces sp. NPDC048612]|uniref:hypothetical protein n=1 Tax=Streptomyces sp. NPDC048612 TaxID=3365579 RepID=UPI00371A6123
MIFFVAVVAQFLPEGHSVLGTTLLLGAVDAVIAAGRLLHCAGCCAPGCTARRSAPRAGG